MKKQETSAKLVTANNKVQELKNELEIAKTELNTLENEFLQKVAKAESDLFSTQSTMFEAESDLLKLQIQYDNYARRADFYYITAPQDCYITTAVQPGIGETVKEGDPIVSIMPSDFKLAVELYIDPMDLPLVQLNQEARFIFDGWPAFFFRGWPGLAYGTFTGDIVAIDNTINEKGKYRILVQPGEGEDSRPWPEALRVGSGAQGIILLHRVPAWYELWRRLNGFPADFYDPKEEGEDVKLKAPAKSIPK